MLYILNYGKNLSKCLCNNDIEQFYECADMMVCFCEQIVEGNFKDEPSFDEKEEYIERLVFSVECIKQAYEIVSSGDGIQYVQTNISKIGKSVFFKKKEKLLISFFVLALGLDCFDNLQDAIQMLRQLTVSDLELSEFDLNMFMDITDNISIDPAHKAGYKRLQLTGSQMLVDTLRVSDNFIAREMAFFKCLSTFAGKLNIGLNKKTFEILTGGVPVSCFLTWSDLINPNPQILAAKIINTDLPSGNGRSMSFIGKGKINLSNGLLTISPTRHPEKIKYNSSGLGVLGERVKILLPDKYKVDSLLIHDLVTAWLDIEKSLGVTGTSQFITDIIECGSDVVVRLDKVSIDGLGYDCTVVNSKGTHKCHLPISEIVRYYVSEPSILLDADPVYLPARVKSLDDNSIILTCMDNVNALLHDIASPGTKVLCKLKSSNSSKGCVWLSEYGYSVFSQYSKYENGCCAVLLIEDISNYGYITGEVASCDGTMCSDSEAFANLVENLRLDSVPLAPEKEITERGEENLSVGIVLDLMGIIESESASVSDFFVKFNILSLLKLMASIISDKNRYSYYRERLRQMIVVRSYFETGNVDYDEYCSNSADSESLFDNYPVLKESAEVIKILSFAGSKSKSDNDKLMKQYINHPDTQAGKMAGLILAGNLLDQYELPVASMDIRRKVVSLLNLVVVDPDETELVCMGSEDLHTEFKTSVIYPADNGMAIDAPLQTAKIISVIAGFLNADGGNLYIGVNDAGVPSGLKSDLDYFQSKDKMELYLGAAIRSQLGIDVNSVILTEWIERMQRPILVLHIPPYHKPVSLLPGGEIYCRQSSSTILLDKESADILTERKRLRFGDSPILGTGQNLNTGDKVSKDKEDHVNEQPSADETKSAVKSASSFLSVPFYTPLSDNSDWDAYLYLHYMDTNEYMLTDRLISNPHILLTIPLLDDRGDEQLVQLFSNGYICRTALKNVVSKRMHVPYKLKNFRIEELSGVAIAPMNGKIMVSVLCDKGEYSKVISVASVSEGKDMSIMGKPYSNVEFEKFVGCLPVPEKYAGSLSRITEDRTTHIGFPLESFSFVKEKEIISKLANS